MLLGKGVQAYRKAHLAACSEERYGNAPPRLGRDHLAARQVEAVRHRFWSRGGRFSGFVVSLAVVQIKALRTPWVFVPMDPADLSEVATREASGTQRPPQRYHPHQQSQSASPAPSQPPHADAGFEILDPNHFILT